MDNLQTFIIIATVYAQLQTVLKFAVSTDIIYTTPVILIYNSNVTVSIIILSLGSLFPHCFINMKISIDQTCLSIICCYPNSISNH